MLTQHQQGADPHAEGADPDAQKALTQRQPSNPSECSKELMVPQLAIAGRSDLRAVTCNNAMDSMCVVVTNPSNVL